MNHPAQQKTQWMMANCGELLIDIDQSAVGPADVEVSSETPSEILCTYNWHKGHNVIMVPGAPPKWKPPIAPFTVNRDAGFQYVDQHAYRAPKYPYEPTFQALSVMKPNMRLNEVDIIINRNSLRKLLDFAAGRSQKPFCMDLHVVGTTLFLSRKEKLTNTWGDGVSYGHNFEDACTEHQPCLQFSSGHHRFIRYRLGNLYCAVRFEVDGYYEETQVDEAEPFDITLEDYSTPGEPISHTGGSVATHVLLCGKPVHSYKIAEIKAVKHSQVNQRIPQLWFGRTPHLLLGQHNGGGLFNGVEHIRAEECFKEWETREQTNLRKLVTVLSELKRVVSEAAAGKAKLVWCPQGPLRIYKQRTPTDVLPREFVSKFWA